MGEVECNLLERNHKIGDLRGMWSIEFSRKKLSKMMYM